MKINSKLTGGLAWAGLIVVLAVPSADLLTGGGEGNKAATITSDMDAVTTPVAPAAVETAVVSPATGGEVPTKIVKSVPVVREASKSTSADPVEDFVKSGKKLPSYISDAPAEVAVTEPATAPRLVVPATGTSAPAAADPVEVASLDPEEKVFIDQVAPIPYPIEKRPTRAPVVANVSPDGELFLDDPAPVAPVTTATIEDEAPLIIDEDLTARRDAAVSRVLDEAAPVAPATEFRAPSRVEADQLEEWDSGSLADYLERRGLMSGSRNDEAVDYDEDGFFLDEGPNNPRERRPPRRFFLF